MLQGGREMEGGREARMSSADSRVHTDRRKEEEEEESWLSRQTGNPCSTIANRHSLI